MSKLFALESDNTGELLGAEDTVTVEEGSVADVLDTTTTDVGEVDTLASTIEEGVGASDDMGDVQALVETAATEGEGLTAVAAEAIRLNVQTICARVGANPQAVYALYATENFASPSSRKANTQYAAEGISEFLKDLWKRLKAALTKLWEKMKAFWDKHVSTLGQVKKALESAKAKVKASSGNLKDKAFIEKAPGGLASAFAGKGDIDAARVQSYIDAQGQLSEANNVIVNAIGALKSIDDGAKVADILEKAPKDVLIVGGELLSIKVETDDAGKSVKLEVSKNAIEGKDDAPGMVVADKTKLAALLESTSKVIDGAIAAKKNAEKVSNDGKAALAAIEKAINEMDDASAEKKAAARVTMNTMYRTHALSSKLQGIYASQNVRLAKAVLGFVGYSLKQYK